MPAATRLLRIVQAIPLSFLQVLSGLYSVGDQLRSSGLAIQLLIGHGDGGVARVAKARAIDTYNSGPAGGIYDSSFMAHGRSVKNVLTMEVGVTNTDIGKLSDGSHL